MKRMICLLMTFSLLLCGCNITGDRAKDPVTFYYVNGNYQENMNEVIVSEVREASGHRDDLPYLLALYLMGPSSDSLVSPLPKGTQIIPTEHTKEGIVLSLSDSVQTLSDVEYTLAAACLSLTCMELTDADQVTITSIDRSITMRADNIMTFGGVVEKQPEETK